MSSITIRPLTSLDEIHALADLQRSAWAAIPDRELVPAHLLRGISANGDLLLGAFLGEQLAGFVMGIMGWADWLNPPVLQVYSATMGVLEAYQSHGIGFQLKLAQREWALQRGIKLVTWTYDPLLARNAWLNVGKLGVICGRYHTHFYGQDEDRFHVEWWLESERVGERLAGMRPRTRTDYPATAITIPIPHDYLALERSDPAAASQWRTQTRHQFTTLFATGYQVVDFLREEPQTAYILVKQS